jgi:hypothetical protein
VRNPNAAVIIKMAAMIGNDLSMFCRISEANEFYWFLINGV